MSRKKPRIALTMGDPLGVGPEIICKILCDREITEAARILVIGEAHYLRCAEQSTGLRPIYEQRIQPVFSETPGIFNPLIWRGAFLFPGEWSIESGRQSLEYVKLGASMCLENEADALVTCAICKAAWKEAGGTWPGHTELLAELCGGAKEVMMLAGGGLRVALVSIHDAISAVPELITKERICDTARVVARDLKQRFGLDEPRIAVLGLNPHAGEDGHIGTEEKEKIIPAITQLQQEGINASGPLPADTSFHKMLRGEYDAILAMYHDQGLGPLKTVAFESGVNITLGLPIIRTSVDHGTAFDIAATGKANPESLKQAIICAIEMCGAEKN